MLPARFGGTRRKGRGLIAVDGYGHGVRPSLTELLPPTLAVGIKFRNTTSAVCETSIPITETLKETWPGKTRNM